MAQIVVETVEEDIIVAMFFFGLLGALFGLGLGALFCAPRWAATGAVLASLPYASVLALALLAQPTASTSKPEVGGTLVGTDPFLLATNGMRLGYGRLLLACSKGAMTAAVRELLTAESALSFLALRRSFGVPRPRLSELLTYDGRPFTVRLYSLWRQS